MRRCEVEDSRGINMFSHRFIIPLVLLKSDSRPKDDDNRVIAFNRRRDALETRFLTLAGGTISLSYVRGNLGMRDPYMSCRTSPGPLTVCSNQPEIIVPGQVSLGTSHIAGPKYSTCGWRVSTTTQDKLKNRAQAQTRTNPLLS